MRFQKNKSLIRLQASFSVVLGNKELVTVSNAGGLWSNNNASILNTSLNYFIPEIETKNQLNNKIFQKEVQQLTVKNEKPKDKNS